MSAFVIANTDVLTTEAALYDARFARTVLFFLGIVIIAGGIALAIFPAAAFGLFTALCGFYFSAVQIPRLEKELQTSRARLCRAIERLGQSSRYGCE